MRSRTVARFLSCCVIACGCSESEVPPLAREPWVDRPVAEWPDFALSNDVVFDDTTFSMLANAFVVDTGVDTIGVTCKHMFMVFRNQRGTSTISLGDDFVGWRLRSSRDTAREVPTRRLINEDPREPIGDFASLKDRDWLIFELADGLDGLYPLKIRYAPVERGETVRAVGRSLSGRHDREPTISPLRVFRVASTYYYVQPLEPWLDPSQTSGSPVIDENGHLVGLVSGAVGRLGVIAGVDYLRSQLERYGVPYEPHHGVPVPTGAREDPPTQPPR